MLILGKSQSFKAGTDSAMAADTTALYWYAPDSVVRSGTTITSWDDKTANGNDLAQISTENLPSYNETFDAVEFDGTDIIGDSTIPVANIANERFSLGNSIAIFLVGHVVTPSPTANIHYFLVEGTGNTTNGQGLQMSFDSSGTNARFRMTGYRNAWQNLFAFGSTSRTSAVYTGGTSPFLAYFEIDSTGGTSDFAQGVETGSFGVGATGGVSIGGIYLGKNASLAGATDSVLRIYEVFASGDNSPANVSAIEAELLAKYSL